MKIPRKSLARDIHMTCKRLADFDCDESQLKLVHLELCFIMLKTKWPQSCTYRVTHLTSVVPGYEMGSFADYMGDHIWVRVNARLVKLHVLHKEQ